MLLPPAGQSEIVDRIMAVVGESVITWSAVWAEASYQAFLAEQEPPPQELSGMKDKQALQKLVAQMVDQALLEQARALYAFLPPGEGGTERRFRELRQRFPDDGAFQRALQQYQLSESGLRQRLQREQDLLTFIEYRLRPQVRLNQRRVEDYYRDNLAPELRRRGQQEPPPLSEVQGQIEQILIQTEINRLLEDWIRELRSRTAIKFLP